MFKLNDYKNIFMIGIGGVSMSGLAYILKSWGFSVSGSSNVGSSTIDKLISDGINVNIPHSESNIDENIDLVVYTAAVKEDNPERMRAKELCIPTMERGEFLGELTKLFKDTIGVAGTHGKTTTTSMVSECFLAGNMDPSIQVGSTLNTIGGNYRVGKSDYFIIESCEYSDSFLNFHEKSTIILNIDNDHLDYFGTFENIKKSFQKYVSHITKFLVLNGDDNNALELKNYSDAKCITFGLNENNDYYAKNIEFDDNGFASYDLYRNGEYIDKINLSIVGKHNVLNSLGCIALCDNYGINIDAIKKGLKNYTGAGRRFEYKGEFLEAKVYDDYGHHPTEVEAVSNSVLNKKYNKSWVIFEPHTFSRVKNHAYDFAKSLLNFDNIILTDIFAAREKNIWEVSSLDIVNEIKKLGRDAIYISDYEEIKEYISKNINKDDLIVTLGAGNITKLSSMLTNE